MRWRWLEALTNFFCPLYCRCKASLLEPCCLRRWQHYRNSPCYWRHTAKQSSLLVSRYSIFLLFLGFNDLLNNPKHERVSILSKFFKQYQRRNEVRRRPGQEASLAPRCSNLRSFGSKCTVLKEVLVTLLGLLYAPRSYSTPPAVIPSPHSDSAPGELGPPCPPSSCPASLPISHHRNRHRALKWLCRPLT